MFLLWPEKIWSWVGLGSRQKFEEYYIEEEIIFSETVNLFTALLSAIIFLFLLGIIPFFLLPIFFKGGKSNFYRKSSYLFFLPIVQGIGKKWLKRLD